MQVVVFFTAWLVFWMGTGRCRWQHCVWESLGWNSQWILFRDIGDVCLAVDRAKICQRLDGRQFRPDLVERGNSNTGWLA